MRISFILHLDILANATQSLFIQRGIRSPTVPRMLIYLI